MAPFVWYSNGRAVRYSYDVWKPDHLASNLFSTIWIPNYFGIQIPTVLTLQMWSYFITPSDQSNLTFNNLWQIFNLFIKFLKKLPHICCTPGRMWVRLLCMTSWVKVTLQKMTCHLFMTHFGFVPFTFKLPFVSLSTSQVLNYVQFHYLNGLMWDLAIFTTIWIMN